MRTDDHTHYQIQSDFVHTQGNKYYKYDGLSLLAGYPQPISDLDPRLPSNLDAVIGFNQYSKTYFIKGRKVWRFDETQKRVDDGYPINIKKVFPGVPSPVSSAFMHKGLYHIYCIVTRWIFKGKQ